MEGEVTEGGVMEGSTPPPPPAEGDNAPPLPPQDGGSAARNGQSTLLTVSLPADAKLYVNDHSTRSTGPLRQFASSSLVAGRVYPYELRAEWQEDGQTVTQSRTVYLRAGSRMQIAFDAPAAEPVDTRLTLNVPDNARVELAGVGTSTEGEVRIFSTRRLAKGQVWDNYTVKVSIELDGQTITQQRTIDLVGGETHDLRFEFEPVIVAANR
jgi:uncharacterized protein (TIGR03000 family)